MFHKKGKLHKIHRKTPAPESFFYTSLMAASVAVINMNAILNNDFECLTEKIYDTDKSKSVSPNRVCPYWKPWVEIGEKFLTGHKFTNLVKSVW